MIAPPLAAACLALALSAAASAAPLYDETGDPARRAAIDNAHQQMATCVAFVLITAEGTSPGAANRTALERLERAADGLIGHMTGLRDEAVTRARIEAERQWLMLAMGGRFTGYPKLREAFGEPCEAMAADPQGHVDSWLAGERPEKPSGR